MCSILFSTKTISNNSLENLVKRGPDYQNIIKVPFNGKELQLGHFLLSITGNFTPQPFISKDSNILCTFNGEIYNYNDLGVGTFNSDGECILPMYEKYGLDFVKKLDGEYAIILINLSESKLYLITDTFSTKPLFFGVDEQDLIASSYISPIKLNNINNIYKVPHNTILTINLLTREIIDQQIIRTFNLDQYKTTYDDWIKAFENSIRKRTHNLKENVFIGLSSGYDSGAISCELLKQNKPFISYSVKAKENLDVMSARMDLVNKSAESKAKYLDITGQRDIYQNYIRRYTDPYRFSMYRTDGIHHSWFNANLTDDYGAVGLSFICDNAIKEGNKIYLSGQGADEIFADYGHNGIAYGGQSSLKGIFPEDLNSVYPWPNFYESSQDAFLTKEEFVAGSYGIEARYPFLDIDVVQEFLNLHVDLKNSVYKSVLYNYLVENKYPFEDNVKRGFSA